MPASPDALTDRQFASANSRSASGSQNAIPIALSIATAVASSARAEGCLSDASRRAGAPWRRPVILRIQPGSTSGMLAS